MSYLHSEKRNQSLQLTVRIKVLNLDDVPAGQQRAEKVGWLLPDLTFPSTKLPEICLDRGGTLTRDGIEKHLQNCAVCASRSELQVDFMECLEAAVYQRLGAPESEKVRGALMVSAPEMNFAICGELEIG